MRIVETRIVIIAAVACFDLAVARFSGGSIQFSGMDPLLGDE